MSVLKYKLIGMINVSLIVIAVKYFAAYYGLLLFFLSRLANVSQVQVPRRRTY